MTQVLLCLLRLLVSSRLLSQVLHVPAAVLTQDTRLMLPLTVRALLAQQPQLITTARPPPIPTPPAMVRSIALNLPHTILAGAREEVCRCHSTFSPLKSGPTRNRTCYLCKPHTFYPRHVAGRRRAAALYRTRLSGTRQRRDLPVSSPNRRLAIRVWQIGPNTIRQWGPAVRRQCLLTVPISPDFGSAAHWAPLPVLTLQFEFSESSIDFAAASHHSLWPLPSSYSFSHRAAEILCCIAASHRITRLAFKLWHGCKATPPTSVLKRKAFHVLVIDSAPGRGTTPLLRRTGTVGENRLQAAHSRSRGRVEMSR